MTNDKQSIDLGKFKSIFEQIVAKYKASEKSSDVLGILGEAILGKITDVAMADRLEKEVKLEFSIACDLAYDLKVNILDKKADLEELKKNIVRQSQSKFSPDLIAEEFLAKLNYKFKDEILKKRYEQAILSWLKDVRDIPELKSLMIRGEKIGGISLPEEVFDRLYDLLIVKKEEIKRENVQMGQIIAEYEAKQLGISVAAAEPLEEEIDVAAKPIKAEAVTEKVTGQEVTIEQLLKEKNIAFEKLAKKEEIKKDLLAARAKVEKAALAPINPLTEEIEEEESSFASASAEASADRKVLEDKERFLEAREELPAPANLPQPATPPPPPPAAMISRLSQPPVQATSPQTLIKKTEKSTRPKMDDVKFTARLYGPVDELYSLSLADFRRLSKDAKQAAEKIRQKIELLEEESIEKKDVGLRALKNSPLYKIYAEIMNKAIIEGKSFEQIISQRQDMTAPEFKAIMDLNKSLKY